MKRFTFKDYLINEAKHIGHKDERWVEAAKIIANGNIKRYPNERPYWEGYIRWIEKNKPILQSLYDEMKSDRNTFIDHAKDLLNWERGKTSNVWSDAQRMRNAELWSGNVDQHDYKQYWKLVPEADNPEEHDYIIMISNQIIDILGGFRDED